MEANREFEKLNKELMNLLGHRDARALDVIDELKRQASVHGDDALLGYAYYRYAYYYYFTEQDMQKFRVYLQQAIRYLAESGDKEYLAGAYNLVAYDAQDQGSFDMAYAYSMRALKTLKNETGIALPGLIESSAGRMLAEIGNLERGLELMQSAISKLEGFTDMHVYNYNMIVSYADIALVSFLLSKEELLKDTVNTIDAYYEAASDNEKSLAYTFYLLPHVYYTMLIDDDAEVDYYTGKLTQFWSSLEDSDLVGLMFELETIIAYMLEHDYITQAGELLDACSGLKEADISSVAIRYCACEIGYYEKVHDMKNLRDSLRMQHEADKKRKSEVARMTKYSMEFADMTEVIAREREERLRGDSSAS